MTSVKFISHLSQRFPSLRLLGSGPAESDARYFGSSRSLESRIGNEATVVSHSRLQCARSRRTGKIARSLCAPASIRVANPSLEPCFKPRCLPFPIGSKRWRGGKSDPRSTPSSNANRHRCWPSVSASNPQQPANKIGPRIAFA